MFDTLTSMRTILKTTDGGANWNIVMDEPGGWLTALDFLDQNNGYLTGDAAQFYKTSDGGSNWIRQTVQGTQWYSNLTSVKFLNEDYGVVGGMFGEVYLYSNEQLPDVIGATATVTAVTDTNATAIIRANINTHGLPASYNFKYSTDQMFTTFDYAVVPFYPLFTNSNTLSSVEFTLFNLLPNTTYYYYAFTNSPNGTVIGDTLSFLTSIPYTQLNTQSASGITQNAAVLNGSIQGASQLINLSFEYGISTSFGNQVSASPASINNTSLTSFSAPVTGLQANTIYYFRAKATTQSGEYYGQTQSFFAGTVYTTFQTDSATNVDQTSATLNGTIDGAQLPLSVWFDFGTTPNLGQTISCTPSVINDAQQYHPTVNVNSLQPNTFYYFRLVAQSSAGNHYGTVYSFFTGVIVENMLAEEPINVSETSAVLKGSLNGLLFPPAQISFEYGTTPSMGILVQATPDSVLDNSSYSFVAGVSNLSPATTYYYRLVATTGLGTLYSNSISFNTGASAQSLAAMVASEVNHTTAELNGRIYNFIYPAQLSFEYGLTTNLGTEIAATQGTVNDPTLFKFSAPVTGLTDNAVYYYRVKAITPSGTFYSDMRKLFTGTPEVTNWDFQDWELASALIPSSWNISGDSITRVAGYTGNYAIRLASDQFALLGTMNDNGSSNGEGPKFMGGCPFSARPDSIIVYMNYQIDQSDTSAVLVYLHAGDSVIVKDFNFISGSSGGSFIRMAFPLNYQSSLMPDSLVLGFVTAVPGNQNTNVSNPSNFMIVDNVSFTPTSPPVCNGDFENWFSFPYDNPLGWHYLHTVFIDENDFAASQKVIKVINNPPDDYALELRNVRVDGFTFNPELSTSPNMDFLGPTTKGFAVSRRYDYVNGFVKFFPDNGDTLEIILLTYLNGNDAGRAIYYISDTIAEFTPFDIKIVYNNENIIPDSATFVLRTKSRQNLGMSRAYFDKFSFDGLWASLPEIIVNAENHIPEEKINLYPNPGNEKLIVSGNYIDTDKFKIDVYDISGRIIFKGDFVNISDGNLFTEINTSDFQPGVFLISLSLGEKNKVLKWIKY